jgi:L-glutamine-phosphate cytidylyltransferase
MKAVILAAGQGTRLRPLTNDRPKCLVELGGVSLLQRQLDTFRQAGITNLTVVGGYRADLIDREGLQLQLNPDYEKTNMVATMFCAESLFLDEEDLVVCYGDIVFNSEVLEKLREATAPVAVCIDKNWLEYWRLRMPAPLQDVETLRLDSSGRILEIGKKPGSLDEIEGQFTGLFRFRGDQLRRLKYTYQSMDKNAEYDGKDYPNMYMTSFLQNLADTGWEVMSVPILNGWLEVDTVEDLDLYHRLHNEGRLDPFYLMNG